MYARANTSALTLRPWAGGSARPVRYVRHRGIGQTNTQLADTAAASAGSLVNMVLPGVGSAFTALATTVINTFFQPNYNNIAAANDVNSIEPYLKSNLATWLSLAPNQKLASVQAAAVATAQGWIAKMEQLCGQVSGSAGQNCISQRVPGGCGFHVAAPFGWINGQFVPSGPNDPTGQYCWDWGYYINSISQDPNVIDDSGDASSLASQLVAGTPTAASGPSAVIASSGGMSLSAVPWWVWLIAAGAGVWAVAS